MRIFISVLFILVKKKSLAATKLFKVRELLNILQYGYKPACYVVDKMNSVKVLIDHIVEKNVN